MVLFNVSRHKALLPLRLLPRILLHSTPRRRRYQPFFQKINASPLSGIVIAQNTNSGLKVPIFSPPSSSFAGIEVDSDEPTNIPDDPSIRDLLGLIADAKSRELPREDAVKLLRTSSVGDEEKKTEDFICAALWALRRDSESALLAFHWAGDCFWECPRACNLLIWILGESGRFGLAWGVIRRMHKMKVLTQEAFVILIERYAAANEPKKAIKTFHALENFVVAAESSDSFYALLSALCKNKNVEEAEELLYLSQKSFPLKVNGFNIILDGWCNIIIDVAEAKRVWREMSNSCITPDGTSYSHMICCFSQVGNLFDSLRLYDEMKKRGWVPNLALYNSLILVLSRHKCFKEAHNVFDKIIGDGLKPDLSTYNSMIYPLCETENLDEAWRVMAGMVEKGVSPTLETFHAFAKAENFEGTMKLLGEIRNFGVGPTRNTFLIIFENFFRRHECENALKVWHEMSKYNVIPDSSIYIELVQGLTRHGWTLKAMEFYNEMKSRGLPCDPKLENTFKVFLSKHKNHWGRGKEYIVEPLGMKTMDRVKLH